MLRRECNFLDHLRAYKDSFILSLNKYFPGWFFNGPGKVIFFFS